MNIGILNLPPVHDGGGFARAVSQMKLAPRRRRRRRGFRAAFYAWLRDGGTYSVAGIFFPCQDIKANDDVHGLRELGGPSAAACVRAFAPRRLRHLKIRRPPRIDRPADGRTAAGDNREAHALCVGSFENHLDRLPKNFRRRRRRRPRVSSSSIVKGDSFLERPAGRGAADSTTTWKSCRLGRSELGTLRGRWNRALAKEILWPRCWS